MRKLAVVLAAAAALVITTRSSGTRAAARPVQDSPGALVSAKGACPLKHTSVKAEVTGFLSRVTVTQEFANPFADPIEAVYTFPLPQNAAVDDMTMLVGSRTIRGSIKRREEARAIYEAARNSGRTASLLDQERPNIFRQSVANIRPGDEIKITISYVETLKYENGTYEFMFPMVVGPRYIPGAATGSSGGGFSPDTDRVPDASRITPQPTAPGTRAGHDISLSVTLDAGVAIDSINCPTHAVNLGRPNVHTADVELLDKSTIPNKDFILRWDVAGRSITDAVLTHRSDRGGFFTLILQPPDHIAPSDVSPKELVFVLDTSGSMSGFPIEKAKESMRMALEGMNPQDTFNLITFAGDTRILFEEPVRATPGNLRTAQQFLAGRTGGGGTEMMKAIRAALDPSDASDHLRIVCFMTDGYVGNDMEIIGEVKKHANARVFAFGIGSAVNRFLLDNMARYGRGEVEYVGLNEDGTAAARRFHERVRSPLLTDIAIDWNGLPVTSVYPSLIPDLFSAKPLIIHGRYTAAAHRAIRIRGKVGNRDWAKSLDVNLPGSQPAHDVLATLWARTRVDELMSTDWAAAQRGSLPADTREAVTQLGLDFRLMTQFTSFVAVEETVVNDHGTPRRVEVPVEMPEGVSYEGVFGAQDAVSITAQPQQLRMKAMRSGVVGGVANESFAVLAAAPMAPPPPPAKAADKPKLEDHPAKLDAALTALVSRNDPSTILVRIYLTDDSAAVLDRLKSLGFDLVTHPKSGRLVIGRVAVTKLEALARLEAVRHIARQE